MEQKEAMRLALQEAQASDRKRDTKKKLKIPEEDPENEERKIQIKKLQVLKAKRLENLLKEDDTETLIRMRNLTINELIVTERDFIYDLKVMIKLFYKPLLRRNIISEQLVSTIFSHLLAIHDLNKSLLSELEKNIHFPSGPIISPSFQKLVCSYFIISSLSLLPSPFSILLLSFFSFLASFSSPPFSFPFPFTFPLYLFFISSPPSLMNIDLFYFPPILLLYLSISISSSPAEHPHILCLLSFPSPFPFLIYSPSPSLCILPSPSPFP